MVSPIVNKLNHVERKNSCSCSRGVLAMYIMTLYERQKHSCTNWYFENIHPCRGSNTIFDMNSFQLNISLKLTDLGNYCTGKIGGSSFNISVCFSILRGDGFPDEQPPQVGHSPSLLSLSLTGPFSDRISHTHISLLVYHLHKVRCLIQGGCVGNGQPQKQLL